MCLGYGIFGSKKILSASSDAHKEAFPILIVANELNQIVHNTNAAIMLSFDGEESFEEDILIEKERFESILENLSHIKKGMSTVTIIHEDYKKYIKLGVKFGKSILAGKDNRDELENLTKIKIALTDNIEKFRKNKQNLFEESLLSINRYSYTFERVFLISTIVLAFFLIMMAVVVRSMIKTINSLKEDAVKLSEGDLKHIVHKDREDELGILQHSFEVMRANLVDLIQNLDKKVNERTHELSLAKKEIEDILINIDQGIVTFNENLSVNTQHSHKAKELFGRDDFTSSLVQDILNLDSKDENKFRNWINLFNQKSKLKRWKKYLAFNPRREIVRCQDGEEQTIALEYQPIIEEDKLKSIMILANDITQIRKAEKLAKLSKIQQELQTQSITTLVSYHSVELQNFYSSLKDLVTMIRNMKDIPVKVEDFFRHVHTIKGWCGTYEMTQMESVLNDIEGLLSEQKDEARQKELCTDEELLKCFENFEDKASNFFKYYQLIFKGDDNKLFVEKADYQKLINLVFENKLDKKIIQAVKILDTIEFEKMTVKYTKLVEKQSENLGKKINPLMVHGSDVRIPNRIATLIDESLVHLLRNAIDHGIELPENRPESKNEFATISVHVLSEEDKIHIKIEDDGVGVDRERIYELAKEKGLTDKEGSSFSLEDAIETIFKPGFSSARKNAILSGRGVGMDAVRAAVESVGGAVRMDSVPKMKTEIHLTFPV